MRWAVAALIAASCWAQEVLLDRIAVVVDESIIKDSDIERDIRVTEFLNRGPLAINQAEKKKAAARLIDQVFLRKEITMGSYIRATRQQAAAQLATLTKQRFPNAQALQAALQRYGLTELMLLDQLRWQLTVLNFIEARFKPAVVISDEAVDQYYGQHRADLRKEDPHGSEFDLRSRARNALTDDDVNRLFFAWLDERRKDAKIDFHEEGLA